jgi:flavin-dependent dehydrogenase
MVEVLIAGAGPAGAVAATLLARAGVRVLVVDRARFPRPKLCGDTLNPGALALLRRLGLAREVDRSGLAIEGMVVTGPGGSRIEGRYERGLEGRAIARADLDLSLIDGAVAAGARFEEEVRVTAPILRERGGITEVRGAVLATRAGRALRLPACVTIAADGRHSTLAFGLGLARHPARPRRWAIGAYFAGVAGLTRMGEMHVRPGCYIGVAPVPGGLANVCLVTSNRRGLEQPDALLHAAVSSDPPLRERFAGACQVAPAVSLGPLAVEVRRVALPGLLLAGDAAGFIDPMTGDGLRFAIEGAELAARAALEVLDTSSAAAFEQLAGRRADAFRAKWRFNRALRVLSGSPSAVRAASVAATLAPGLVRRAIAIAGDAALA